MKTFYLKNPDDLKGLNEYLEPKVEEGPEFGIHVRVELGQRTPQQNKAIHVYCDLLAEKLNSAGFLLVVPGFKEGFSVPWDGDMVKNNIWRVIQIAMFEIKSTTQLNRAQVSKVYEVVARNMAEKGIDVPFPQNRYPED